MTRYRWPLLAIAWIDELRVPSNEDSKTRFIELCRRVIAGEQWPTSRFALPRPGDPAEVPLSWLGGELTVAVNCGQ